jgi:hypothetical protein
MRLAWLAQNAGWSYWLDIIDLASAPAQLAALARWLGRPLTPLQIAIFTASLIEMGLLNCTHVIAAMTGNTKGSQWVPYEYGRIKEASRVVMNAASWWDSTTIAKKEDLPEYLHLSPILEKETAISAWLGAELGAASKQYPNCSGRPRNDWPKHIAPPRLPPTG